MYFILMINAGKIQVLRDSLFTLQQDHISTEELLRTTTVEQQNTGGRLLHSALILPVKGLEPASMSLLIKSIFLWLIFL